LTAAWCFRRPPLAGDDDADASTMLRVDGSLVTKRTDGIAVIDRSTLYVGQTVGSASDMGGQIGVVTGVTTTLDLVRFNSRCQATKVVMGVTTAALRRFRPLSPGDYVVSGRQWLGRVVQVSLDIDILFDDGAICKVTDAESTKLKLEKDCKYRPQTNTRFYPGASLLTRDSSDIFLDNAHAQWLNGQWEPDRHQGKVTKVEMAGVLVCWIASAEYGVDQRLFHEFAPPAYQYPDNLTYFCSDPDCTWGLGDRCFLLSAEEENNDHADQQNTSSQSPAPPLTMTVGNTNTTVDVLWQDGTRQHARSTVINPTSSINGLHFFPGQYVVDNSPTDDVVPVDDAGDDIVSAAGGSTRRIGVVRSQNSKDQTVNVSWFKAAASTLPDNWEVECDDIVSAYELIRDPDHSVFFGDVVVHRQLSNASESTPGGQKPQAKSVSTDLSWVGRVLDLHDGHVQVKWGDDSTSTVCLHVLFLTYIQYSI
jgi:ubiquitin-conjugating enzyme E2 O